MKISKSLLQAIAVGIAIGTTTPSCETIKKDNELHLNSCTEDCAVDHATEESENWDNCPACGMG